MKKIEGLYKYSTIVSISKAPTLNTALTIFPLFFAHTKDILDRATFRLVARPLLVKVLHLLSHIWLNLNSENSNRSNGQMSLGLGPLLA